VLDNETLVRWDVASDAWIHSRVTQQGLAVFDWITRAGSPLSMSVLGVVVGALLLWQRRRTILIPWIAALAGGGILDNVIKQLVHRTRPVYGAAYLTGHSYSFPSGHAMGSIIAIGMLLYVLGLYWHPSRLVRISSIIVACIFVVLVGVSRVYLGVHYPSDVMGGWAAGAAWMAVCVSGASFALHRYDPV
jgi:membrane-associated phospholipid phosphatase